MLRVEPNADIQYVAKPSGQAEATFKLIRASASEAVFEKEETKNGKTHRIAFNYQRAKS